MSDQARNAEILERYDYAYHPLMALYPPIEDEQRAGMKESIRVHGVIEPLRIWTDPKGKTWLVDGRTRRELWIELVNEGHLDPEKHAPQVVDVGSLTEPEMLSCIHAIQVERRQLNSSQQAAIIVLGHQMWLDAHPKKDREQLRVRSESDVADSLSKRYGTNRDYLFKCQRLFTARKDLLEKVARGDMAVMTAYETYQESTGKKAPEQPDTSSGTATGKGKKGRGQATATESTAATAESNGTAEHDQDPPPPPEPILDGEDNPINMDNEDLVRIFKQRFHFSELLTQIKSLQKGINHCLTLESGHNLKADKQVLDKAIRDLKSAVEKRVPYVTCPECLGTGKPSPRSKQHCKLCGGARFLDKVQNEQVAKANAARETKATSNGTPAEAAEAKATA